jgi:GntR family transcriptional regulator, transcriptional repressor for pyruvate dehydrogenase complex
MSTEPVLPLGCYRSTIGGPKSAIDNSVAYVRSLIHSGQVGAGERLPTEGELCERLEVSRVTLRAALKVLETLGYVVVRRGKNGGSWAVDRDTLRTRWFEWVEANKHRFDEMLAFQRMVEREIASLAAVNRTPEDIERLEAGCTAPLEAAAIPKWDLAFRNALLTAAHNEYLERAVTTIRGDLFVLPPEGSRPSLEDLLAVHRAILEAVRNQDSERAVESLAKGMAEHYSFLDQLFKPGGATQPE